MPEQEIEDLIADAAYSFAMGDAAAAREALLRATAGAPRSFEAWHSLAEVALSLRNLDEALAAAEKAEALAPQDPLAHATLSRIWMERGDKPRAEHFGAQARIHGWRTELKEPPRTPGSEL